MEAVDTIQFGAVCPDLSREVVGGKLAGVTGLEPATSAVTGQRSEPDSQEVVPPHSPAAPTRPTAEALPPVMPPCSAAGSVWTR